MAELCAVLAALLTSGVAWMLLGIAPDGGFSAVRLAPREVLASLCTRIGSMPVVCELGGSRRVSAMLCGCDALSVAGRGREARLGCAVLALALAALLGAVLVGSWVGAIAGSAACALWMASRASKARSREAELLEEAMPEVFRMLSTALGSGSSLAQAVRYVGDNAEGAVSSAFSRAAFSMDCGVPVADALDEVRDRLRAPGLDLVVSALKISQRTGAPLKGLLDEASGIVSSRMELRRSLDVKTSQARLSARVVALMPIAMTGFLALVSGDFQRGLSTVPGMCSVAVALALDAVAWFAIRRIMEVDL